MLFSVIIPCYNAARTIELALDSLVVQLNNECEIICIDDCSQDNTREIIRSYSKRHEEARIILLCNEKNSGPGIARNIGIGIAQGEYLCFLDADDNYVLSTFSVLRKTFERTQADVVLYGLNQVIGNTVRKHFASPRNSIEEYMALAGESLCGGCWHRALWKGIQIPPISNAEDIAVIPILISRATKVIAIDNMLYNYVHSNTSTSSQHHPKVSYNFVASFHYTLEHIDVERFRNEVEFHGIKTIIYGATLNALKAKMSNNEVLELWSEFEQHFPNWINNVYLKKYEKSKHFFIRAAANQRFAILRCYAFLHDVLLRVMC